MTVVVGVGGGGIDDEQRGTAGLSSVVGSGAAGLRLVGGRRLVGPTPLGFLVA